MLHARRRARVAATLAGTLLTLALVAPVAALEVGQKAPDFELPGSKGQPVKLSELTAKGPVVIYTFIQAFTNTLAKEIRDFDAALPQFEAAGAQVVGISADHQKTLEAFAKQENVKHLLLSDFRRAVIPKYDAMVTDEKSPIFR